MNYWFAEMTNMDVVIPLFDYFEVCYQLRGRQHRDITDLEYLGSTWGLYRLGSVQHQLWLGNSQRGQFFILVCSVANVNTAVDECMPT